MPELNLEGVAVLAATITLPRVGRWHADLTLDDASKVAGRAVLASADGAFRLVGTVERGGGFQTRGRVTLVGGGGDFERPLPAHYYRGVPGRVPVADILRDCGERLSPRSDAPGLSQELRHWTRLAGPANVALAHALDALGATWRVEPGGAVRVFAAEAWPAVELGADVMDDDPARDRASWAFDAIPADLLPGTTVDGRRVSVVVHEVRAQSLRTRVEFEREGDATDRSVAAFEGAVRHVTRATAYHAQFPARAVAQSGDGATLDVIPQVDLPPALRSLPPMVGVPIRCLAPGVRATVPVGTDCFVGFEEGRPDRPYVTLFDNGATNLTELKIGANATKGAVRVDDPVASGTLVFSEGAPGTLVVTYTPPGGSAQVTSIAFVAAGGVTVGVVGGTATITGKPTAGSLKTFIE